MSLRLRRGTDLERLTVTPAEGEIFYATDTQIAYIGDGVTVGGNIIGAAVAHTIASHSDTTATGAELETLTDGSNADSLHEHEGTAIASTGEVGGTKFLREDGDGTCSWQTPAGTGDVVGPGSATDEAVCRFDLTTGKLIQNSSVTITDAGVMAGGEWQGTSISTTYTDAKCTDATADNTSANETSHADVVQDGDFSSNGLMERTGAGAYAVRTLGIADTNIAPIDATAGAPGDDEFARFTATGLEGRTAGEVLSDIGAAAASHNIASHSDTTATGTELETLTDGSNADLLHVHEGTAIKSTGEVGGTKFLREDGDGTCSWQTAGGGGGALSTTTNDSDCLGTNADDVVNILRGGAHGLTLFDDFTSVGGYYGLGWAKNQSGGNFVPDGWTKCDQNHIGASYIFTGSGATNWAVIYQNTRGHQLGGGAVTYETCVLTSRVADGSESYQVYAGLGDQTTSSAWTEGVYFYYDEADTEWQCKCTSSSSTTTTDSGITVAADTWYRLRYEVNAAASSVEFFIDGASVATITTNIPSSGDRVGPIYRIIKSVGTNTISFYIDYFLYHQLFTTPR